MKPLVLYYSRTGNTRAVARIIAGLEKADIEEIRETKPMGYLGSGIAAWRKKKSAIMPLKSDVDSRSRIYIGQPVWAWTMVPAVRTLAETCSFAGKDIRLFCTMEGSGGERCLKETEKLTGPARAKGVFRKPMDNLEHARRLAERLVRS